ncbi:hypothetical protein [Thiothrix nivea]|uniref:hypothetical protein n=1 Tax=Thiothrix nivea TaxID=1031 RepID=UPI0005932FB3|nr:hypothetical protein [Thiothrix nivea]
MWFDESFLQRQLSTALKQRQMLTVFAEKNSVAWGSVALRALLEGDPFHGSLAAWLDWRDDHDDLIRDFLAVMPEQARKDGRFQPLPLYLLASIEHIDEGVHFLNAMQSVLIEPDSLQSGEWFLPRCNQAFWTVVGSTHKWPFSGSSPLS